MSGFTPFQNAHAKVRRARKHIVDLENEIADWKAQEPFVTVATKHVSKLSYTFHRFTAVQFPPDNAMILGDAIHNLRVALDVLANDVVALCGVVPKSVYFPVGTDPDHFETQMKEKMKGATPEVKAFVRSLQPWRGGNVALRALHDLDIQDKHIEPLVADLTELSPPMQYLDGKLNIPVTPFDPTRLGNAWEMPDDQIMVGTVVGGEITVVLAKKMPLAGKPAVETLAELTKLVEGVISTFEAHFLRGKE